MIPSSLACYQIHPNSWGAMVPCTGSRPGARAHGAIKTQSPCRRGRRREKTRFVRKRVGGRSHHPNIVTIYDVDVAGEVAFIAMEYLEGRSLRQLLDSGAALSLDAIADIAAQIAGALDYAGRFGVVHRDTKPANIMVSAAGYAKLTDFGLAYVHSTQMTQRGSSRLADVHVPRAGAAAAPRQPRRHLFSRGRALRDADAKDAVPAAGNDAVQLMESIVKDPCRAYRSRTPRFPGV